MAEYDPDTHQLRRMTDLIMLLAGLGLIVSLGIVGNQYLAVNRTGFEARFFPPTEDWTFRDWEQGDNGRWSAVVHFYKDRGECLYVRDQIVTVTYVNPLGEIGESRVNFIGDSTPGNSRPEGWQRIDRRMEFISPDIVPGTILRGNFLHQCSEGLPITSGFQNVIVGHDMPWPNYVDAWIENDMDGSPSDYR